MGRKSPAFDAYIARSADFARPILKKLRASFHRACPQIEETMKWSFPHFEHKGVVGSMAAFKQHVRFGFWKGSLLKSQQELFSAMGNTDMFAAKITSVSDLPPDAILLACIREAVLLNEQGVKVRRPKKTAVLTKTEIPAWFRTALKLNKKAQAAFDEFSPSHQREYVEWLTDAKQQATRDRRLATALEWLAEGKPRHWKYMKK